jgi:hypothetical protein
MGGTGLMGASGASAFAEAVETSPFALAIDDCAEAGAAHSREQNNAGKRTLIGESTTLQFRGAGAQRSR